MNRAGHRGASQIWFRGEWKGSTVVIVGGGPSASLLELFSLRKGIQVISVNQHGCDRLERPLVIGPSDTVAFVVTGDQLWLKRHKAGHWGVSRDPVFGVPIIAVDHDIKLYYDDALVVDSSSEKGFWGDTMERVRWGLNSGLSALNIADILCDGEGSIHLFGFDCDSDKGIYPRFRENFQDIFPLVRTPLFIHGNGALARIYNDQKING